MAVSKTSLANMAISHLGTGDEIADLDTENSPEARSIRRFYEVAQEEVLRDHEWPFARRSIALGLVAEDPTTEYKYAYRYPSTAVKVRRIFSGVRNDTRQTRVAYQITGDDTEKLIYTDEEDAVCEFTERVTDENTYPRDFVMAFSYLLAMYAAPRLTKGDPFKLGDKMEKKYRMSIGKAAAGSFNEQQDENLPDSSFINARS